MIIRPATESDFQKITIIHAQSWKDSYSDVFPAEYLSGQIDRDIEDHWRNIEIQNEDIVLVAEEKVLVGFVAVWCRPSPFIDNLHVIQAYRSKEIGSALMRVAAKELMNKRHSTAYLWAFESNSRAIRFYERLGGIQKEKSTKTVFGYNILHRKIEWNDLSKIFAK